MNTADDDSTTTAIFARPSSDELGRLPAVLTTREAASALGIGVKEVRMLVDTGALPAARFGPRRVIRIARSALVRALRAVKSLSSGRLRMFRDYGLFTEPKNVATSALSLIVRAVSDGSRWK